ncbi:testicular haploid expressed gene protein isoform X2 [Acinonyx jubatus]|uniref:Testicular haploid expressed gene protein isoform X2 n=1 Tax=Acinonyx jubatus TaxID=32536 RepID=A0ABM3PX52_ACIJB|nr:testicular haploid expressed gene protein isoform X2 [Acinonyx jubatus]
MECGPRECECGRAILLLPGDRDHRHTWVLGSKAAGLGRTQYMGDRRRSLSHSHHGSEAEGGPDWGQDDDALGVQGTVFRSPGTKDTTCLDDEELSFEDREAETLPEEVTGGEPPGPRAPEEALEPLERVLEKDAEGIPEMSRLSITQRLPSAASARGVRRRRKRVFELAKPKTNWQVLRHRMGCCCKGYAWVSPCKRNLQFCVYWPSVYWTERFLEDTTLTVTVPVVTRRVEELARPKRFYSEYFNNNRSTSVWPVPRPTLAYQASSRLRELATPRVRNNIWSINMSEVNTQDSQVSAQDRASFCLKPARGHLPCPRGLKVGPRPSAHTRASQRAWNRSVRSEPNTGRLPAQAGRVTPVPPPPLLPGAGNEPQTRGRPRGSANVSEILAPASSSCLLSCRVLFRPTDGHNFIPSPTEEV